MVNIIFQKYYLALFTFFLIYHSQVIWAQSSIGSAELNPNIYNRKVEQILPATESIWDVEFNYDATAITGAAGNAGAVYIPTINKFWTSRWATNVFHQWNTDGTLDFEFTLPFTGTRNMCFDGQYVYHATATTTIQKVDPVTRTVVGTISVIGAPNGARSITYNPDTDGGSGGIIVGNWFGPNLNFYEFSMTGTLLRIINNSVTGINGIAYDNWTAGAPFLWVFTGGAGQGTPQFIQQMDYNTGLYTGVQHDVKSDVGIGQPTTGIAGGMFITDQLIPSEVIMGGILQGSPDLFFGYRLGGQPCLVEPATNPTPANGATNVSIFPGTITWTNGIGTTQVEVFFGQAGNMVSVYSGAPITSYAIPTPLNYFTTYQWKVICKNDFCQSSPNETWAFTTEQDPWNPYWIDDFENGIVNWTITNDGGTVIWQAFNPPYPNPYILPFASQGGVFAADVDNGGSTATCLTTATISHPFNFSNPYSGCLIEFDNDWQALDIDDFGYVEISIDGGNSWTAVRTFDVDDVRNTHEVIDIWSIAAYEPEVYIRLRTVQPGWDWWWAVDNFKVIPGIIPVELISFTASVNHKDITLTWSTATELNNSGFQIERSSGSEFVNAGFVAGHGTTTKIQNYSFVDQNVVAGTYTYRLKQIDFNGTFEYSKTIEVEVIGVKEFTLDQNYPNPFNPSTKINFNLAVDSKVSLKIFNVLGQEVATLINEQMSAGSKDVSFDASSLNSGVYFYRIDANGVGGQKFSSVKKMILTK